MRADNRPSNLRYLCPNCDALLATRGGRNKGRVTVSTGGFAVKRATGKKDYTLVMEPGRFQVTGSAVELAALPKRRVKPTAR